MGDRILAVNDEDLTQCNHQDAVMALLKPGDEITLKIQHDPLPEGFQVGITILSVLLSKTSVYSHNSRIFKMKHVQWLYIEKFEICFAYLRKQFKTVCK